MTEPESIIEGTTLKALDLDRLFRSIQKEDELERARRKTTRTSLHPESRSKMDFETQWMESELLNGKHLFVPPTIYQIGIEALRDVGMYEEAIENIHTNTNLSAIS